MGGWVPNYPRVTMPGLAVVWVRGQKARRPPSGLAGQWSREGGGKWPEWGWAPRRLQGALSTRVAEKTLEASQG